MVRENQSGPGYCSRTVRVRYVVSLTEKSLLAEADEAGQTLSRVRVKRFPALVVVRDVAWSFLDRRNMEVARRVREGLSTPPLREPMSASDLAERAAAGKRRSAARCKQLLGDAMLARQVDHLVTLTYRECVSDVDRAEADLKRFLRLLREREGVTVSYVAVRELQQRGAWHWHLAVRGRLDVRILRRSWYQALGGSGDERGRDAPGAVNARAPRRDWSKGEQRGWNAEALIWYLGKYLAKTFADAPPGSRRFRASPDGDMQVHDYWRESGDVAYRAGAVAEDLDFEGDGETRLRSRMGGRVVEGVAVVAPAKTHNV
jgi:hypothetical protein